MKQNERFSNISHDIWEKKSPYRIWRNKTSSLEKGNMRLAKHRPFSINCGITTYLKGIIQ